MKEYKEDTFILHLLEGPFSSNDISKFRVLQVINSARNKRYHLALEAKVYEPSGTNRENLWNFKEKSFYVTAGIGSCVFNDTEGKVQDFCDEHQCKLYVRYAPSPSRYDKNNDYLVLSGFYKKKSSSEKLAKMPDSIPVIKPPVPWWHVDMKPVYNAMLLLFFCVTIYFTNFYLCTYFYGTELHTPKQSLIVYNVKPTYHEILLSLCPKVV